MALLLFVVVAAFFALVAVNHHHHVIGHGDASRRPPFGFQTIHHRLGCYQGNMAKLLDEDWLKEKYDLLENNTRRVVHMST